MPEGILGSAEDLEKQAGHMENRVTLVGAPDTGLGLKEVILPWESWVGVEE